MNKYIPLEECEDRVLYRINCRNLTFGVFNKENNGFIGIREKFGAKYLFTEYHFDTGAPFGTVKPYKKLGLLPNNIDALEVYPHDIDRETKRPVMFDKPKADGGKGWYFLDTGEADENIKPCQPTNKKLFDWLDKILAEYNKYIPLELCEDYAIYRLNYHLLDFGVFHDNKFIGICNDHFLTMYHIDAHGTIPPVEKIGELPKDIPFEEHLPGTIDKATGRLIEQNKRNRQWYYIDNGEACNNRPAQCDIVFNNRLKEYLQKTINAKST